MDENGFGKILSRRVKGKGFFLIASLELEAWIVQLVGWVPGALGFAIRSIIYRLVFGKLTGFSFIQSDVKFVRARGITAGKNFTVNSGSYINGIGGIAFGDNVLIGPNVVISSGEHPTDASRFPILFQEPIQKKIEIGHGVWIGANAVILPGIEIGINAVVAANAVVTKNIGSNEIWGGVPARYLKSR